VNEQLLEPNSNDDDIFEVFEADDLEVDEEAEHETERRQVRTGHAFIREFDDPDIELCGPDFKCLYDPNRKIKDGQKNWSSQPFMVVRNCQTLAAFRDKVIEVLGPTRTSGEKDMWQWNKGQHLKPKAKTGGVGCQLYCSFGGRANEKRKQVIKFIYLFSTDF
jgi:hypothetical protein